MNLLPENDLTWHLTTLVFEVRILMHEVEHIVEKLEGESNPQMRILRNELVQKVECLEQIMNRIAPAPSRVVINETVQDIGEKISSESPWQALAVAGLVGMLNSCGVEQFCKKERK
ncbi:hypothetical protein ACO0KY_08500 [Undibacterium sp. Dicai25W]|uniref:hypothetical protein n=1 Tax=Undibacterium sp. Dicai25W TaxID=3413034 RepID=UPI003BF00D4A